MMAVCAIAVCFASMMSGCEDDDNKDDSVAETTESTDANDTVVSDIQLSFSEVSLRYALTSSEDVIIRTAGDWASFTNRAVQIAFSFPPSGSDSAPPCDLNTQMLAVKFLGQADGFPDHLSHVSQVVMRDGKIEVYLASTVDDHANTGITYAYVAICMTQSSLPVVWIAP